MVDMYIKDAKKGFVSQFCSLEIDPYVKLHTFEGVGGQNISF